MKKIYMLAIAMFGFVAVNAQSDANSVNVKPLNLTKADNSTTVIKPVITTENTNKVLPIWSSDFSDVSDWTLTNENTGGLDLDWAVSTNPAEIPVTALAPFASTTAANGFLFINSDANNTTDFDGTIINVTAASPVIDLSAYPDVVLNFSHNYRWWHDDRIVRVSGDNGATFTTYQATDVDGYDGAAFVLGSQEQNSGNPQLESIDISDVAGGMSEVIIEFVYNDNDYWGWYWAVDDVEVVEKPANDVQLNYSVISHVSETGIEYPRTPVTQQNGSYSFNGNIYNFGINDQENVTVTAEFTNGTDIVNLTENLGTILGGESMDFELASADALPVGVYEGTFTVVSDAEVDGDNFGNNVDSRIFEITEDIYSMDALNLNSEVNTGAITIGNYSDDFDNPYTFGGLINRFDMNHPTVLTGLRVFLGTAAEMAGSEIQAVVLDTLDVMEGDMSSSLAAGDSYIVTAADVSNGFIDMPFLSPFSTEINAYYVGINIIEGENFSIVDDMTVPQPGLASVLFLEQAFSNPTALGIHLMTAENVSVEETNTTSFNMGQNVPNPASDMTKIIYNSTTADVVTLEVIDITGKTVMTLNQGTKIAGTHSIELDVNGLSAGVYTYTLTVGNEQISKRMIIK